jgi:molybdopterin synthase sulfur carrier subunit
VATLLLFAAARRAAGLSYDVVDGDTLADVIDNACARYGPSFREVLAFSRVWVNSTQLEDAPDRMRVGDSDEIAVLPPISGG